MQVGVIGINHKQADVAIREAIAKAILAHFSMSRGLESAVLLLTCNRAELYFSGSNLAEIHQQCLSTLRQEITFDFEQKCYSFFGRDCFFHLAQVTSGLDSAVILETEIQGQVKQAYEMAKTTRKLSSELHFLFQKSLHIGKTIRARSFEIKKTAPSLEQVILFHARDYFAGTLPSPLFIGASEINLKIAAYFVSQGLFHPTFCNRTNVTAKCVAEEYNGQFLPWEQLQSRWKNYSWIIAGAKSTEPLLRPGICLKAEKRLLIDLAVPRNIHPEVEGDLFNIDDFHTRLQGQKAPLHALIGGAHVEIKEMVERYVDRRVYALA